MPKKTTILILILAVVTAVLVYLAVTEGQKQGISQTTTAPTQKVVAKTSKVFFSPQTVDLSSANASNSSTADLVVDTGNDNIAGVQAELQYDPKVLTNVKLIPAADATGFFGPTAVVLFNDVNPTTGRISYAIAINAGQATKKGVGKIATLSFSKTYTATPSTTITFLDKTLVTKLGENESVLKGTAPLTVILNQTVTQTPVYASPTIYYPSVTSTPTQ